MSVTASGQLPLGGRGAGGKPGRWYRTLLGAASVLRWLTWFGILALLGLVATLKARTSYLQAHCAPA